MSDLRFVQEAVGGLLTEVAMHFKGRPKITLIVRHPDIEADGKDADFVMTDDTLEAAIAALQRRSTDPIAADTPAALSTEPQPAGLTYADGLRDQLDEATSHLADVLFADPGRKAAAAHKAAREWWNRYDRAEATAIRSIKESGL